jgi:nitrogen regulatory protein PII
MFCVVLVLHDYGQLEEILDSWRTAGAPGITIIPTSGMARLHQNRILEEDMPLFPSIEDFTTGEEIRNVTIFSIVSDESTVDQLVAATETVTGNLNGHNTGILFVLPVMRAYGLNRKTDE